MVIAVISLCGVDVVAASNTAQVPNRQLIVSGRTVPSIPVAASRVGFRGNGSFHRASGSRIRFKSRRLLIASYYGAFLSRQEKNAGTLAAACTSQPVDRSPPPMSRTSISSNNK